MITYRIKDWSRHFENNRTKEMQQMRWVPVPNKHDGEGYLNIMAQPDGIKIYGCWHLILQVASKCLRDRGTLLRDDGTPLTARSIAIKTGWRNESDIQRALDFCSSPEVGWIEALTTECAANPQAPAEIPQAPAWNRIEGNGIEGKGTAPADKPQDDAPTVKKTQPKPERPSIEQATAYAREIGLPASEAQSYLDYYTSNGWRVGRTAMKDWRAAMRNWKRRAFGGGNGGRRQLVGGTGQDTTGTKAEDFI